MKILRHLLMVVPLAGVVSPCVAEARVPRLPFGVPSSAQAEQCLAARGMGFESAERGEWIAAARHFEAAIRAFPDSQSDWYSLGCMLSRSGDLEGSIRALGRARDLGRLYMVDVSGDPDLEPLHGLPAYDELLQSLLLSRTVDVAPYADGELARSREEMSVLAAQAEESLAPLERVLGAQLGIAMDQIRRRKSASLEAMARRAATTGERSRLRWEALLSLLDESMRPASEHLAKDVLLLAETADVTLAEHSVDGSHAAAHARWAIATLDAADEAGRQVAMERLRTELLEIAASAADQPALEGVLAYLMSLTIDDLPLSSSFYRRSMTLAADPVAARRRAEEFAPGAVLAVEGLPVFRATTTSGVSIANATLAGHMTLIDVWATWCSPCVADLPKMRALANECRARGVEMIGIAVESGRTADRDVFVQWCADHQIDWPQVLDTGSGPDSLSESLGITAVPHYLLIDSRGRVIAAAGRAESMRRALQRIVPAAPPKPPAAEKADSAASIPPTP